MDKRYCCYCGLYCGNCSVKTRVEPAGIKLYEELKSAGFEDIIDYIPDGTEFWRFLKSLAEHGACESCRDGSGNPGCAVRLCAQEKTVDQCAAECEQYPCSHFSELLQTYPELAADNDVLRKEGSNAWAERQRRRQAEGFAYTAKKT